MTTMTMTIMTIILVMLPGDYGDWLAMGDEGDAFFFYL